MSYKNSEGYTDLTACIAIRNAMKKRKEKVRRYGHSVRGQNKITPAYYGETGL